MSACHQIPSRYAEKSVFSNFYLNSLGSLTCCHVSASQDGGHATWLQACSSGGLVSTHSLLDTSSVRFPATDLTQDTPRVCSPTPHDTEHWFHTLTSHLKKTHSLHIMCIHKPCLMKDYTFSDKHAQMNHAQEDQEHALQK